MAAMEVEEELDFEALDQFCNKRFIFTKLTSASLTFLMIIFFRYAWKQ